MGAALLSRAVRTAAAVCVLLVAAPLGADDAAPVSPAALEVELATTPQVYLVVDTGASALEVRSRGVVLDRIPLAGLAVVRERRLLGGEAPPVLELPALWRVVHRSGRAYREIVTPGRLEPYSEDKASQAPARKPTPTRPPETYEVRCDSGWNLAVAPELPPGGLFARWRQAIGGAWARAWGLAIPSRPTLALALAREDAERLHHLFRVKTAILLR